MQYRNERNTPTEQHATCNTYSGTYYTAAAGGRGSKLFVVIVRSHPPFVALFDEAKYKQGRKQMVIDVRETLV